MTTALDKWERLKHRAAFSPHGERTKRAAELRDHVRRSLGYGRALKRVQRREVSRQGGQHGR